jgi:hypothetical protein
LKKLCRPWKALEDKIEKLITMEIANERIEQEKDHVNNPECEDFYKKPREYARSVFLFYACSKCGEPYYGGRRECGAGDAADDSYLCPRCSREFLGMKCPVHGEQFMVYKCFWCCNPATFLCYGNTTHFCSVCHEKPVERANGTIPYGKCDGKCPFSPHPPNGTKAMHSYCTECERLKHHG